MTYELRYNRHMLLLVLSSLAFGETLLVEAKIPTALYVDGQAFVEFSRPGRAEFEVAAGEHKLVIMTNGNPTERVVNIGPTPTRLVVGRTGISLGAAETMEPSTPEAGATTTVELRSTSRLPLLITVDDERYVLAPGATKSLTIANGDHAFKVRNDAGTAIFATGTLALKGTTDVIVQLSEGRVPEVAGDGAEFFSN